MRTISFERMYEILNDCAAVIWGDMKMVVYPSYWMPEDKSVCHDSSNDNFLHLEGTDEDFNEFEVDFKEKDNEVVKVEGNHFFLIDTKGNEVEIRPLFSKDLSEYQ